MPTQDNLDLSQYAGTWFEQARLPNRFQKKCKADVQADYALVSGDRLSVTNQCVTHDGKTEIAVGEGRIASSDDPDPAILEVRFAPSWLSWLPWVWGDYWIISTDYQYSLVGTPDRNYLWVLSRKKNPDEHEIDQLLNLATELGFDTASIQMTIQN